MDSHSHEGMMGCNSDPNQRHDSGEQHAPQPWELYDGQSGVPLSGAIDDTPTVPVGPYNSQTGQPNTPTEDHPTIPPLK